jgi:hypothetical protein
MPGRKPALRGSSEECSQGMSTLLEIGFRLMMMTSSTDSLTPAHFFSTHSPDAKYERAIEMTDEVSAARA